jgi:hypothetical protein
MYGTRTQFKGKEKLTQVFGSEGKDEGRTAEIAYRKESLL